MALAHWLGMAMMASAPTRLATSESSPRHLIYLHGRIIQSQQSPRPHHPRFGYYELQQILDRFSEEGFTVSGDIRPLGASVDESATRIVEQVQALLAAGVDPERIAIVGGSMGGAIGMVVATRLGNPDIRFAILGSCLQKSVAALSRRQGGGPTGRILAVREASDDLVGPCPAWDGELDRGIAREIVLDTGLSHGFLYRPIPEWVNPVLEWLIESKHEP